MKKLMFYLVLLVCLVVMPVGVQAYTINDSPANDAIGYPVYETYGINVYNFTPGTNSGNIQIDLFSNYPASGDTVVSGAWSWTTSPADLFITETWYGSPVEWAVPLVNHGGFVAGGLYAVGTSLLSDSFDPSGGAGYIYNHGVKVQIASTGSNPGGNGPYEYIGGGSVTINDAAYDDMPYYKYSISLPIYEDDPNGSMAFLWGTATCANDVITGQVPVTGVPEPATMLLLGLGLMGLVGVRRKFAN